MIIDSTNYVNLKLFFNVEIKGIIMQRSEIIIDGVRLLWNENILYKEVSLTLNESSLTSKDNKLPFTSDSWYIYHFVILLILGIENSVHNQENDHNKLLQN